MTDIPVKRYDLERRTEIFAKKLRSFLKEIPITTTNEADAQLLAKHSAQLATSYIAANTARNKKDFLPGISSCLGEAKKCRLILRLLEVPPTIQSYKEKLLLEQEATELIKIFTTVLAKSK